jgi:hypothetical protein
MDCEEHAYFLNHLEQGPAFYPDVIDFESIKIFSLAELIEMANERMSVGQTLNRDDIDEEGQVLSRIVNGLIGHQGGYVVEGCTVWCVVFPDAKREDDGGPIYYAGFGREFNERMKDMPPDSEAVKFATLLMEQEVAESFVLDYGLKQQFPSGQIPAARDIKVFWKDPLSPLDPELVKEAEEKNGG